MDKKRQLIYLGALLHDIGKFYQRADNKQGEKFNLLKSEYWSQPEIFCPSYKGSYSRKHVLWTAQFIDDNKDIFNKLDIDPFKGEDSLLRLAALHHKPETVLQKIIQKADWYSSAVDRSHDQASINDGLEDNKWNNFKKRRMVSVFEAIANEDKKEYNYGVPVKKQELSKHFFPKKYDNLTELPDYKGLWENFQIEFKNISTISFDIFIKTLLYLLEKYTITIPSSTNHLPDVSLFDHSKTTAAFAVSLYDYYKEKNNLVQISYDESITPVRLIGADISGIQSFIYDIVSKNAAKNLKGRSFYLQLIVDSILRYIIEKLELFPANIVYSSGGGFYLLASNTQSTTENLLKIEKEISEKLFEKHKTTLFVAIDSIELSESILLPKNDKRELGKEWQKLIENLNRKKRQKHIEKITSDYKDFFEPIEQGGESKNNRDAITGDELDSSEKTTLSDGSVVSKTTKEQIQLGKDLKDAKYWIVTAYDAKNILKKTKGYNPLDLGYYYYFMAEDEFNKITSLPDNAEVLKVNETEFLNNKKGDGIAKYSQGFTFYGGNSYPVNNQGNPVSFDKLAGTGDFKRLGVLRMDVDNLGQIFMSGFAPNKRTFSRYSTLSRSLDYFFKGYLNKIQEKYKDNTYILYAGGDDLFVIGKWDVLIKLAKEIKDDFADWTCHNHNISISGGIAIVTAKFPIMKAAYMAAEEEQNAKEYKNNGHEKNAFSLMGYALSWKEGYEFETVSKLKDEFISYLNSGNPKSLIGFISGFFAKRQIQKEKNKNESWQWQMAYQLARFAKSIRDKKAENLVDEIKIDVFTDTYKGEKHNFNYHYIELLNLAARWAELEYRTNK